jgi:acyl-CoA synthetase (AMP-forming)/AMP-acid ligase II/acyl carrier protein
MTILDVLAAHHARRGSAPAILAPDRDWLSYAALYSEIDRLGTTLATMGLGRDSRIALALADGPEGAVTMLATMIWATAVPLGTGLDLDTCMDLLARLRIDAVIMQDGEQSPVARAAKAQGVQRVHVSSNSDDAARVVRLSSAEVAAPIARVPPQPDDVAVLMQTSGTTSRPKIVPVTHAQLHWSARQQPIDEHDRCLAMGSIFSSSGMMTGVLGPLSAGAATVITGTYDGARFVDWLDAFKPTYLSANPTVLASMLDALASREPAKPPSLRFVRAGSNALPPAIQHRLESALGVPVIQGYGMTETGHIAQNPLPPGERRTGSVGVAQGIEVMILHDDKQPALGDGIGEILVRGPSVMRGYEDDAEANTLAFHDGWFRTGDLGWIDDDGYLFITGRIRELINRGGMKVSPSEVDLEFMQHPAVREAATFGIPHPSLGEDVVTAIVLHTPGSTSVEALRAHALQRLLPFKVPSSVVLVDEIPRNVTGKVSRGVLRERLADELRVDYLAPRNEEEALVAAIFAEIFELPRVGAFDHYFRLGGDSLRATQVVGRLADRCGVEMEIRVLFESPTVAELAERIRAAVARNAPKHSSPPIRDARLRERADHDPSRSLK